MNKGIYWMIVRDKFGNEAKEEFIVIDKLPAFKLNYKEKRQIKNHKNKRFACVAMFRHKQHNNSQ